MEKRSGHSENHSILRFLIINGDLSSSSFDIGEKRSCKTLWLGSMTGPRPLVVVAKCKGSPAFRGYERSKRLALESNNRLG